MPDGSPRPASSQAAPHDVAAALAGSHESILRVVRALVAEETATSRGGASLQLESLSWDAEAPLKDSGPALDSLELLDAAARISQFFRMHEVGVEDYLLLDASLANMARVVAKSLEIKAERLTFLTSGSTGAPKKCVQTITHLARDAAFIGATAQPRRIVALTPPHHIYGFIYTVLAPLIVGAPAVDRRGWPAGKLRADLRAGDLVVGTPYLLRNLERAIETAPAGVAALSSTAPLSPDLAETLAAAGFTPIYEVYGSSETGGVGWRRAEEATFSLFPWRRLEADPLSGASMLVATDADEPAPAALMDQLEVERESGRFRVVGRCDNAVQVGGENVFPQRIEAAIETLACVEACHVRATPPEDGARTRLKAFVKPAEGWAAEAVKAEVEAYCRSSLAERSRPSSLVVGDAMPVNEIGKRADW